MDADLIGVVMVAVLSSSVLVTAVTWAKDRKKDRAAADLTGTQALREVIAELRADSHDLRAEVEKLRSENASLRSEIAALHDLISDR